MKRWPIGSRLAVWTAFFLTIELVIFGIASGWVIYKEGDTFDVVGSGLGLSICREIALAHGGSIWLERQEPGWTAFVLALPCPGEL